MTVYKRLDELCDINMGQSPASESYNEVGDGLPFFQGNADFGELYPTTRIWCNAPTKIVEPGTILISVRAPIGALNYSDKTCCIGRGLAGISSKKGVESKYIYYCLKSKNRELNLKGTGSTFKAIAKSALGGTEVKLVSEKEQKQIVYTLDAVSKTIKLRKQQLSELDNLIKSRFVEMFDEFETTTTIARYIAELRGGKSLAGTEECRNKVLKTGAATFGWFDPEQYKYLPIDYKPLPEHKVEAGDVIISRMNTPELVGACSYVFEAPENMYYPDRLWKVIPEAETNPIFLWQLLWDKEIRRQIKEKSGGTSGTMHNISKSKLLEIKCIDAPIKLQNQFSEFVEQVNKSKFDVQKSIEELQTLYDSLMQKYFG